METDVALTADGDPVMLHDASVIRTTDGTGKVYNLSTAYVRSLVTDDGTPSQVPFLTDSLALLAQYPDRMMQVEPKPGSRWTARNFTKITTWRWLPVSKTR